MSREPNEREKKIARATIHGALIDEGPTGISTCREEVVANAVARALAKYGDERVEAATGIAVTEREPCGNCKGFGAMFLVDGEWEPDSYRAAIKHGPDSCNVVCPECKGTGEEAP